MRRRVHRDHPQAEGLRGVHSDRHAMADIVSVWVQHSLMSKGTPGRQHSLSLDRQRLAKALLAAPLARTLGAVLIDQDVATGPLLNVIGSLIDVDDIDDPTAGDAHPRWPLRSHHPPGRRQPSRRKHRAACRSFHRRNGRISTPGKNSLIDFTEQPAEP